MEEEERVEMERALLCNVMSGGGRVPSMHTIEIDR